MKFLVYFLNLKLLVLESWLMAYINWISMLHILNLCMWINLGTKRTLIKENSYSLWHRRLGHISKERIQRLVSSGAIGPLDYSDLGVCTNCIKGKQTNIRKFGTRRSSKVLDLVYTDICSLFLIAFWNGHGYFITFTDDYSRYEYLYLIHEKSQSLDMFKIHKTEVENQ